MNADTPSNSRTIARKVGLTDAYIRNIKPGGKTKHYDEAGLYLFVHQVNGGKYWRFKYKWNKKEKVLALGIYPDVSLREAREMRNQAIELLRNGTDPSEIMSKRAKAGGGASSNHFETIAREWMDRHLSERSPDHKKTVIDRLEKNVFPWIGEKEIRSLSAAELLQVARRIENRGATEVARRVLGICGQIFRYAVSIGRADRDPSADLRGMFPKRDSATVKHHASITDPKQVGELMQAIQSFQGSLVVKYALQLAPLVFVRPGELRAAEWLEVDLDGAVWKIASHRMKMKQVHIVPLSRQAVAILRAIHPLTGKGKYIFPSARTGSRPMSENTINASLRRLGYEKDEMTGHGFRSMASTLLHESGWPHDVIERQLAHSERNTVSAAYNYAQYLPERKKMMQAWADYLDGLTSKSGVISLLHRSA